MPSGNGLNAVKHHRHITSAMENERQQRREIQLLEDQRSATLTFLSTKDRTIAAKMLVVEAHRYQRALNGHCVSNAVNEGVSHCEVQAPSMTSQRYFRDIMDDIGVLMSRVPSSPIRNAAAGHQKTSPRRQNSTLLSAFRTPRDHYLLVKNELAGIDMWRNHRFVPRAI